MGVKASQLQRRSSGDQFDESRYKEFFARLSGNKPYPYQTKLARELTQGKSLILRAPTGSGKTWATVAPFIYAAARNNKFADRLIYALPLRALASNLHETTNVKLKALEEFQGRVCSSAKNRRYRSDDPFYLGLQMGGQQDDPFFEGDITFTTIDQLLSAYLFAPVSLPGRVGNIGAGALIGSFLVFDEVHLLDPQRSLATTIEMLVRLKGLAQFVLMTATMPDSVMEWLAKKLEAEPIALSEKEVLELPSHSRKQREFQWRPSQLTAKDIASEHKDRTIAIVNSVGRSQELYREVCSELENLPNPPTVFLLHARFFPQDRKSVESKLADYFGPDATLGDAILISTQVVEAGIDISADVLLTELAPLNSLLQRAGRVARYADRNAGKFLVFALQTNEKGQLKLGPYRSDHSLVEATQELLSSTGSLSSLNYLEELEWLERIHSISDMEEIKHLTSLHEHRQSVLKAMDGLDDAPCSRLVRDISSVNVVLTSQPEALRFTSREWPELLSVQRTSLFKLEEASAQAGSVEWALKVPEEIQSESNKELNFQWRTINNPAHASWLVAIHPAYASYSEKVGLELGEPSKVERQVRCKPFPPVPRYSYKKEHFVTHAKRVAERGSRILERSPRLMGKLAKRNAELKLRDIFMLACTLHDTGKLQTSWQAVAEKWQKTIDDKLKQPHKFEILAHTNFDPERDRGEQWSKFPPHAACGGFALLPYFLESFPDDIAILLCTAITRHHGTHTSNLAQFELIKEANAILAQCLPPSVPQCIQVKSNAEAADLVCFSKEYLLHLTEKENWWPLYASTVRLLRLADQGSFQD